MMEGTEGQVWPAPRRQHHATTTLRLCCYRLQGAGPLYNGDVDSYIHLNIKLYQEDISLESTYQALDFHSICADQSIDDVC